VKRGALLQATKAWEGQFYCPIVGHLFAPNLLPRAMEETPEMNDEPRESICEPREGVYEPKEAGARPRNLKLSDEDGE
jgi:hypothetical protein